MNTDKLNAARERFETARTAIQKENSEANIRAYNRAWVELEELLCAYCGEPMTDADHDSWNSGETIDDNRRIVCKICVAEAKSNTGGAGAPQPKVADEIIFYGIYETLLAWMLLIKKLDGVIVFKMTAAPERSEASWKLSTSVTKLGQEEIMKHAWYSPTGARHWFSDRPLKFNECIAFHNRTTGRMS